MFNVGERITYFRQKKHITVNKLANMAGISQSYLRDLELGKKQPTVEYLSYICDALNISLVAFFADDEDEDTFTSLFNRLSDKQQKSLLSLLEAIVYAK